MWSRDPVPPWKAPAAQFPLPKWRPEILQLHSVLLRARELLAGDCDALCFREVFARACKEAELDEAEELQRLRFSAIISAYTEAPGACEAGGM